MDIFIDGKAKIWFMRDCFHKLLKQRCKTSSLRHYFVKTALWSSSEYVSVSPQTQFNGGSWSISERQRKEEIISVSVSNPQSTRGNLVVAGYNLLKAPNTTHQHQYTQHLLSWLPKRPLFWYYTSIEVPNGTSHSSPGNPMWRKTRYPSLPSTLKVLNWSKYCSLSPSICSHHNDRRKNKTAFYIPRDIGEIS